MIRPDVLLWRTHNVPLFLLCSDQKAGQMKDLRWGIQSKIFTDVTTYISVDNGKEEKYGISEDPTRYWAVESGIMMSKIKFLDCGQECPFGIEQMFEGLHIII